MSRADEPAFPLPLGNENVQPECAGLTKREYFAALAMQGMLGTAIELTEEAETRTLYGHYAFTAVKMADALLAELAKKPEGA